MDFLCINLINYIYNEELVMRKIFRNVIFSR